MGLRYYFLPVGNLRPFATIGLGYHYVYQDQFLTSITVNRSLRYQHWRTGAGASYLLNNKVAIDLSTGYQQDQPRQTNGIFLGGSGSDNQYRWRPDLPLCRPRL